jgi:hypothetical protein
MDANTICQVKNRSASTVVYSIPEMHIRREFAAGETKRIPYEELEKLSFQQGGRGLMTNFLQIQAEAVTDELNIQREPEYNMSEEDIIKLIQEGSLDSFLDCLDFAPTGIIDLIKSFSISLPMNDLEKRRALKEKTGFDVTAALANLEKERAESNDTSDSTTPTRRVQVDDTTRRTTPEYKVVSTED